MPLLSRANPFYRGPESDHFDGRLFFNPGGEGPGQASQLLRWRLKNRPAAWPESFPSPFPPDRPPERVDGDAARLSFVGHASLLLQTGGLNMLFDPVWSERCSPFERLGPKRHNAPGIGFDDLPPIDVVCVSHSHYDHMDRATLRRLQARFQPRFVTPLGNDALIHRFCPDARIEAYDWLDRAMLNPSVAITFEPTHHWGARGLYDRRMTLWASFAVHTPAGLIYVVGDSGFFGGANYRAARERHGPPKLAMLPIGAYAPRFFMAPQHQDPDEAVRAARFLEAEMVLGSHWGTFQLTDEAVDEPVRRLAAALAKWQVDPQRFVAARPGLVHTLPHSIDGPPMPPLAADALTTAATDHEAELTKP
ncbi:MBL fold metallo-hydrolase [Consotaella aegiceratis]|uniref:MBL fold metallo-hydrolase n=1 Tax=Consotaella aegiceratis TaxID=3097961 RepID=UPI002F3FB726